MTNKFLIRIKQLTDSGLINWTKSESILKYNYRLKGYSDNRIFIIRINKHDCYICFINSTIFREDDKWGMIECDKSEVLEFYHYVKSKINNTLVVAK
jgi:hypothetical protein